MEPIEKPNGDDSGQNPAWPGEDLQKPGTRKRDEDRDEVTIIPIIR